MNPKSNLPPVHPEEFLKENLDELRIPQAEFTRSIELSAIGSLIFVNLRMHNVLKGKSSARILMPKGSKYKDGRSISA